MASCSSRSVRDRELQSGTRTVDVDTYQDPQSASWRGTFARACSRTKLPKPSVSLRFGSLRSPFPLAHLGLADGPEAAAYRNRSSISAIKGGGGRSGRGPSRDWGGGDGSDMTDQIV